MSNRDDVYFFELEDKIVQDDPVKKANIVTFHCNNPFRIRFTDATDKEIDPQPALINEPADQAINFDGQLAYDSRPRGKEHVIKVKFRDTTLRDLHYTVEMLDSGKVLDPRVVPPK